MAAVSLPPGSKARAIVLALLLFPLGWLSLSRALDMSLESRAPLALARVSPGTPNGLAARAQLALAEGDSNSLAEARKLLAKSLASRPLDAFALRLYALTFGGMEGLAKGQMPSNKDGEPYFRLAERASRRDVSTQLYLVLADGQTGDVRKALGRIDRTLRASKTGRERLFPVLGQIISRPDGQAVFVELVEPDSPWLADFLSFAIDAGVDPGAVARATVAIGGYPDAAGRAVFEQSLVRALDSRAEYRTLARLLPRLRALPRGVAGGVALDAKTMDDEWAPLNWQTTDSPAIRAYPQATGSGASALAISMGGGVRGRVVRKLVALSPGTYRLDITQSFGASETGNGAASAPTPEWTVSCLDKDPPTVLLALSDATPKASGAFSVGPGCPLVQVALFARSPDSAADSAMTVERVAISRR